MRTFDEIIQAMDTGPRPAGNHTTVMFETYWTRPDDGWCIASRGCARAMHSIGIPVRLHSPEMAQGELDDEVRKEVEFTFKVPPYAPWRAYIFSSTLGSYQKMQKPLEMLLEADRPRGFFTMFERMFIERQIVDLLNRIEGVWVPCTANKEVMNAAGVRNVSVIPFPWFDDDPFLKVKHKHRAVRRFLWIGRWEPRKAPDQLLRAFMREFRPGEAQLTMKLSGLGWGGQDQSNYISMSDVLREELERDTEWTLSDLTNIEVIHRRLSIPEMVKLYERSDVYVSASRGEGYDLPCFQAKLARKKVVTTDSGGPRDFLGTEDVLVPTTGALVADPAYEWGPGALYANYSLKALQAALRSAWHEPSSGKVDWDRDSFHYTQVGAKLKEWIDRLQSG